MTSWQLVRLFAGTFILLSLALGIPGSPIFVSHGGWPSPPSSAPTCCRARSRSGACWRPSCASSARARASEGSMAMRPWCERKPWRRAAAMLPLAWLLAGPAWSADLVDAWRAAQGNDLEFAAAHAARQAGEARREQGASFWRPSLQFSGTVGMANNETLDQRRAVLGAGLRHGRRRRLRHLDQRRQRLTRWALEARQPLVQPRARCAEAPARALGRRGRARMAVGAAGADAAHRRALLRRRAGRPSRCACCAASRPRWSARSPRRATASSSATRRSPTRTRRRRAPRPSAPRCWPPRPTCSSSRRR